MITHDRGSAVVAPPYGGDEARIVEESPADAIVATVGCGTRADRGEQTSKRGRPWATPFRHFSEA
jgi:hypothetical protein